VTLPDAPDYEARSTETQAARLCSRAWLARGFWDCDQGLLELSNRRLRFVTKSGEVRLDVDVAECSTAFETGTSRTGLRVETASEIYRFWFSNPYLGLGALTGSARATGGEWVDALSRMD
jgi:hypothetical protein